MKRLKFIFTCLLVYALMNSNPELSAQGCCSSFAYCEDDCFNSGYPMNVYLSHIEGKGVGYHSGYTTLGYFATPNNFWEGLVLPFMDVRGHFFNDGKWAGNVGFGMRFFNTCLNSVLGINVYYDVRQDKQIYQQGGVGFEWMTPEVTIRLNGYCPFGDKSYYSDGDLITYDGGYFAIVKEHQKALGGVDAEIETSVQRWVKGCSDWDLFVAVGPYYFDGLNVKNISGGRVRLGVDYSDYLRMEVRGSYDKTFHTIVQGLICFNIPFGLKCCGSKSDCCMSYLRALAMRPVQRNEIIIDDKCCTWKTNF